MMTVDQRIHVAKILFGLPDQGILSNPCWNIQVLHNIPMSSIGINIDQ